MDISIRPPNIREVKSETRKDSTQKHTGIAIVTQEGTSAPKVRRKNRTLSAEELLL